MIRNIKIFEIENQFCFTVDKFSSLNHHHLTKHAQASYRYAWEACKDANKIAKKHPYHLEVCKRYAIEDLMKPIIDTISAESRLVDHYKSIYDNLVDTAQSCKEEDDDQNEINYQEAKMVVTELLTINDNLEQDEQGDEEEKAASKEEFESIISKIGKLVRSNYRKELDEDVKKSKEAPPAPPQGDMSMEGDPMGGMGDMGDPMGDMGGMPMGDMGGGMPMASSKELLKKLAHLDGIDHDTKEELLDEYGSRACKAIQEKHPKATYKIASEEGDIIITESGKKLIYLDVGKDLTVSNITPLKGLSEVYPFESLEFYQAYWKPIVESVGHCSVGNQNFIVAPDQSKLPDIPKDCPKEIMLSALHKDTSEVRPMSISFKGNDPSWFIEPSEVQKTAAQVSEYTEEEYLENGKGALVMCDDPSLPSYYGQTGSVVQVVPLDSYSEIYIDFGNHVVTMTEDQFTKINTSDQDLQTSPEVPSINSAFTDSR